MDGDEEAVAIPQAHTSLPRLPNQQEALGNNSRVGLGWGDGGASLPSS